MTVQNDSPRQTTDMPYLQLAYVDLIKIQNRQQQMADQAQSG